MPDYMFMLESRLSAEQRAAMMRVQELAAEAGANVYLTGGAVRDLISGAFIRDLDFTIEGNPARLATELEKGGAKIVHHDDTLRQVELIFSGDVDGSISAAHEEVYTRPGTKPEIRWSTITGDLHRRDFSINAIAISLNAASRGLLLDPTNGLADLENREIRALTIHSFTNHPIRLMRAVRFSARMDFKLESRTADWFALAIERRLQEKMDPADVGSELRQLGSEQNPAAILKAWESRGLIAAIHPLLERKHPDYELLGRLVKARDELNSVGLRPRLLAPVMITTLGNLNPRERSSTLSRLGFRSSEISLAAGLEAEVDGMNKMLVGKKTEQPDAAFAYLEKAPTDWMAFSLATAANSKAINKIRNYLRRWRPLRQALPAASLELESLGVARGPKFDKIMEAFFHAQLSGKGRTPEECTKLLRKLAGIKEPPAVKEEKKKPVEKGKKKAGEEKPAIASSGKSAGKQENPKPQGKPSNGKRLVR
jgi:tRNA nucleotidyltransferase (CCA-adding enzyme)